MSESPPRWRRPYRPCRRPPGAASRGRSRRYPSRRPSRCPPGSRSCGLARRDGGGRTVRAVDRRGRRRLAAGVEAPADDLPGARLDRAAVVVTRRDGRGGARRAVHRRGRRLRRRLAVGAVVVAPAHHRASRTRVAGREPGSRECRGQHGGANHVLERHPDISFARSGSDDNPTRPERSALVSVAIRMRSRWEWRSRMAQVSTLRLQRKRGNWILGPSRSTRRFGVPLEKLAFVRDFMLQPKADDFRVGRAASASPLRPSRARARRRHQRRRFRTRAGRATRPPRRARRPRRGACHRRAFP